MKGLRRRIIHIEQNIDDGKKVEVFLVDSEADIQKQESEYLRTGGSPNKLLVFIVKQGRVPESIDS